MDTLGLKNQLTSKSSAKERHTGNSFKRSHSQLTDEFPEMLSTDNLIIKTESKNERVNKKKRTLPSPQVLYRSTPPGLYHEETKQ